MTASATTLKDTEQYALTRRGRFLVAELRRPHRVLSTCQVNGGEREALRHLINHQSCEGRAHESRYVASVHEEGPAAYHGMVCEELGLDPATTAVMGTAANMQYAALEEATFEGLTLTAVVTAGVAGNAARAGEPGPWVEDGSSWREAPQPGTINTMLISSWPLTAAAQSRAVVMMTEAKGVALQQLAVPSKRSSGLATGTGTDQYGIAAPLDNDRTPRTWTGHHTKLGELIATSVIAATREALRWQNGLEASTTRSLFHALGRYGVTEEAVRAGLPDRLSPEDMTLFEANFNSVIFEPQLAGCAYAFATVLDRLEYGTLPSGCGWELLLHQAAMLAAALATRPEEFPQFREALASRATRDHVDLVLTAVALGWQAKWTS